MSDVILETRNLTKEFKGFTAVSNVNLKVQRGTIHALIGPNGAARRRFQPADQVSAPTSGTISSTAWTSPARRRRRLHAVA
jgi:branched-chain amino acid transport system ATP-binding protein